MQPPLDHDGKPYDPPPPAPERPVELLTRPFQRFLHVQAASGVVLAVCTVVALAIANSGWAAAYRGLWETNLRIGLGGFELSYPISYWINDALMAVFFFVVGLEIKRELVIGELAEPKSLALPVSAALGGAIVPTLIYYSVLRGSPAEAGWAVPMATDIAFVVGALALLGDRVPRPLKVLMLSLAIVDDIMGVAVIALFYATGLKLAALAGAGVTLAIIAVFNRLGVRRVAVYVVLGGVAWLFTLKSGVHPTIAGVALGLLTPATALFEDSLLLDRIEWAGRALRRASGAVRDDIRRAALIELCYASTETVSPLVRLETALHPWVGFLIMPVFALANAAVPVSWTATTSTVSLTVAGALVLGKPLGILLGVALAHRVLAAELPRGTTWLSVTGSACLGGIGFTMAIFIATLGLDGEPLEQAKSGVLLGSLLSALLGMALLHRFLPRATPPQGD